MTAWLSPQRQGDLILQLWGEREIERENDRERKMDKEKDREIERENDRERKIGRASCRERV